jgi:putative nucleotidyltransferase with HDIG domain
LKRTAEFTGRHIEKILAVTILFVSFFGTFLVKEKTLVLNFYYLPVVFAAYFLGKRLGVLTALLSILTVVFCVLRFPGRFLTEGDVLSGIAGLSAWGGFLILTSYAVGSLCEQRQRKVDELRKAYIGILEILSKYLESKDHYTKGHSERVGFYGQEIALAMKMSEQAAETIRAAGLLHDIGKIEISSQVLSKAASLSRDEKALIDTHSSRGAQILTQVGAVLKDLIPIVEAHHRQYNGSLDPSQPPDDNVPVGARIIAVADSFDAMTTDRPYRRAMTFVEAMLEISVHSGGQFDPVVVRAFQRVMKNRIVPLPASAPILAPVRPPAPAKSRPTAAPADLPART